MTHRLRLLLALALVSLPLILVASPAQAKSFSFPRVQVDIDVQPDGSFRVREERTFDFDGSFSRGFLAIPAGRYEITDVGVAEDGTVYEAGPRYPEIPGRFSFESSPRYRIDWFYLAADERRTFVITYTVRGAVVAHNDVAEFYWQFIGDEWDQGVDEVVATVRLPAGATREQVRVWGHGPLEGDVRIQDPQTLVWEVSNLRPATFVEGRIAFPPSLVPGAPKSNEARLPAILREEQEWADEANRARAVARFWNIASPVAALAALGVFVFLFFRYGKEPDVPAPGRYLREPPADYSPAILGYLMRFGKTRPVDMAAVLMDLARRGHLQIDEVREEEGLIFKRPEYHYNITRTGKSRDTLTPYEAEVMKMIERAGGGSRVVREDALKSWAKANPSSAQSHFQSFKEKVKADAQSRGLLEPRAGVMVWNGVAAAIAIVVTMVALGRQIGEPASAVVPGIVFLIAGMFLVRESRLVGLLMIGSSGIAVAALVAGRAWIYAPGPLAGLLIVIAVAAMTPLLQRRTGRGATDFRGWKSFRRFLKDRSRMEEKRPGSVVLWEKY
ncbi:MAG TPA: DUF2207 domain-containing protein, partial [Actinomycetota bacterium]|nr:DUF2207 domain-containing protein [Actinomycetota bacterium]